jgi:outer membrane protein OmpA-like peptidoglycan-associated protein
MSDMTANRPGMSELESSDSSVIVRLMPVACLGLIFALLLRACAGAHTLAPVGAVPTFDADLAIRVGNHHAMVALQALPPDATGPQLVQAMNLAVIRFVDGGTRLAESTRTVLARVARVMLQRPAAERYVLSGHSSGQRSELADLDLSRRQALVVVAALVDEGVPASRLQAVGIGDQQPLSTETSEEARFRNRRIEFSLAP